MGFRFLRVLTIGLCLAFYGFAPSPAAAQPPQLHDFLSPETLADVAISPDGQNIASLEYDLAKSTILVRPFDTPTGRPSHTIELGEMRAFWIDWANDERLVAGIIVWQRFLNLFDLPFFRVVAMDLNGENQVTLFNNSGQFEMSADLSTLVHPLPDNPSEVLMGASDDEDRFNVYRVNVYSGEAGLEATGTKHTIAWIPNQAGELSIRIDEIEARRRREIYSRPETGEDWKMVASYATDASAPMAFVGPTPQPSVVLVRANNGHDKAGLHFYDLKTDTLTEVFFQNEDYDVIGAIIDGFKFDPLGAYYAQERVEIEFVDEALSAAFDSFLAMFSDAAAPIGITSDYDSKHWIIELQSPQDPGTFYAVNFETQEKTKLGSRKPKLTASALAPVMPYTYQARDGLTIPAYLTLPVGDRAGPVPLVVMPHGGPEARDMMQFDPLVQFIASKGIAVFQPNFRGSAGYGTAYAEMGYGEWGGKMQDDVIDGLQDLIDRGVVDPSRVCIVGASYGGYAALFGAMATPEHFKCAVSIAGVTDLPELLLDIRKTFGARSGTYDYTRRAIGRWPQERKKLIARSPARNAEKVGVPIFIIHGAQDDVVPVKQAHLMRDALKKAGKPFSYLELERSSHHSTHPEEFQEMLVALDLFLARHLLAHVSAADDTIGTLSLSPSAFTARYGPSPADKAGRTLTELHQLPINRETFTSRRSALTPN